MLMDSARMEVAIAMKDLQENIVNIVHVQMNAILKEYARKKESVYVIKASLEMIVQPHIALITVIIMEFAEIILVIVKINGQE